MSNRAIKREINRQAKARNWERIKAMGKTYKNLYLLSAGIFIVLMIMGYALSSLTLFLIGLIASATINGGMTLIAYIKKDIID